MTDPFDLLRAGRFAEAASGYRALRADPSPSTRLAATDGLAQALCGLEDYRSALPLLTEVHRHESPATPGDPGRRLEMACAHWCLDERSEAIGLLHGLCADLAKRRVARAPDLAGGATFGLILHYMAVTTGVPEEVDYALACLTTLATKYDRWPSRYSFPVPVVRQLLGQGTFEQALEVARQSPAGLTPTSSPEPDRPVRIREAVALFHDGAQRRARGDEVGCLARMRQVIELSHRADLVRWYLARHEVARG
jgi:hypothetical protein